MAQDRSFLESAGALWRWFWIGNSLVNGATRRIDAAGPLSRGSLLSIIFVSLDPEPRFSICRDRPIRLGSFSRHVTPLRIRAPGVAGRDIVRLRLPGIGLLEKKNRRCHHRSRNHKWITWLLGDRK